MHSSCTYKSCRILIGRLARSSVCRSAAAGEKKGYGGGGGGNSGGGNLKPWECSSKCGSRCSQTQYHKACITLCNKCCASASACRRASTATRARVPATATGRQRKEGPNAPRPRSSRHCCPVLLRIWNAFFFYPTTRLGILFLLLLVLRYVAESGMLPARSGCSIVS
jgi:hypothetical protein